MTAPGRLEGIWLKRAHRGPMDAVDQAMLVVDRGLVGNADQGGRRQVAVIEREVWDSLKKTVDAALDPSARRANLLVSGVRLERARGRILCIGACRVRVGGELRPG